VPFEILLNALWVCLGVSALGLLACRELQRPSPGQADARSRRILAVVFAILFLFPCVSESDDLLTLQNLQFTLETRGEVGTPLPQNSSDERPGLHLERFFATLQTFQPAALYTVLVTLLCIALIRAASVTAFGRCPVAARGRAPPRSPLY
jgi:hypothetical protein